MTRSGRQDGFTLIEILMVMVIAASLLAIALPSFLGQKAKATDAVAQTNARTAETAMAVYRTDHGSYACGTDADCVDALHDIEDSIPETGVSVTGEYGTGDAGYDAFRVTAVGGDTRTFWITRRPGDREQGCAQNSAPSPGGCRDGHW